MIDVCLANTAMSALGALHASYFYSWNTANHDASELYAFLNLHQKEIKSLNCLTRKYKIRFKLYFYSSKLYRFLAVHAHNIISVFNKTNN